MKLSKAQSEFLKKELSVTKDDILAMTKDQWHKIRERCLDIEVEEAVKEDTSDAVNWDRCNLAVSVVDLEFEQINSKALA